MAFEIQYGASFNSHRMSWDLNRGLFCMQNRFGAVFHPLVKCIKGVIL